MLLSVYPLFKLYGLLFSKSETMYITNCNEFKHWSVCVNYCSSTELETLDVVPRLWMTQLPNVTGLVSLGQLTWVTYNRVHPADNFYSAKAFLWNSRRLESFIFRLLFSLKASHEQEKKMSIRGIEMQTKSAEELFFGHVWVFQFFKPNLRWVNQSGSLQ